MYEVGDKIAVDDLNLTAGETKYTLKNLKKGKTYYIRVRAASFDKQWSVWSKVKKIKVT